MNTNKHTPGPWRVNEGHYMDEIWTDNEDEIFLATVENNTGDNNLPTEETEANARLIAAAPELLAALEGILKVYYNPDGPEYKAVIAAIRKAKGE